MTLADLVAADYTDLADPLALMALAGYRWGDCCAIKYDPARTDLFPGPSFLVSLYERCREAGGGKLGPLGIVPALFCNMRDVSCEAVVAYLHRVPIIVVGEWRRQRVRQVLEHGELYADTGEPFFHPLGFTFPTGEVMMASLALQPSNRNAIFAGYGFFEDSWRTPQQTVCMYLGLSYLFQEFKLGAIHGTRFADNHLTARFAGKFGFRDVGHLPCSIYRYTTGDLAAMTVSTLSRQTFSDLLRGVLDQLRAGKG